MTGTYVLSAGYFDAYYLKAQKVRRLITDDFRAAFQKVDLLVGPTTPTPAFAIGAKIDDPVTMYLNDIYTIGANLAGLPGLSMPLRLRRRIADGVAADRTAFLGGPIARRGPSVPARDRVARPGARAGTNDGQLGGGDRPRDPCAARHEVENLFRIGDRLRRRAEYAGELDRSRLPGRAAGAQRARPCAWRSSSDSPSARPLRRDRFSRARTTSTRTCRRAIRSASTSSRWSAKAPSPSCSMTAP